MPVLEEMTIPESMPPAAVVAVTGAFGCLGSAVARAFAAQGARVCAIDAAAVPPAELVQALGPDGLTIGKTDLTSQDAARTAFQTLQARFGRLDVLVNVAGGFRWETFEDGAIETWDRLYTLNLKTAVVASKAALPLLLECGRGRIVNVAAGAAVRGMSGMGAYSASKAGVLRLTEALADELKDRNVTVNAVLPSIIDTPQNRRDMPDAEFSRWVRPESIAAVVSFLASDAASAITGAGIPVAGRC